MAAFQKGSPGSACRRIVKTARRPDKSVMMERLLETGWTHNPSDGFLAHVGGLWERQAGGVLEFGFLAQPCHANRNGFVHGGMLMTFIDRAFGQTARLTALVPRSATIQLSHNFIAPMRIGDFAVLRPEVVKSTARLCFLAGNVTREDEVLVSAQGIWRLARSAG